MASPSWRGHFCSGLTIGGYTPSGQTVTRRHPDRAAGQRSPGPPAAASTPWTIFGRVRLSVAKTAAEGGILRARGVVGGIFTYRDESRSRHFDLVGEGEHPWTIDLATVTAAAILVVGFASALVAHLVR